MKIPNVILKDVFVLLTSKRHHGKRVFLGNDRAATAPLIKNIPHLHAPLQLLLSTAAPNKHNKDLLFLFQTGTKEDQASPALRIFILSLRFKRKHFCFLTTDGPSQRRIYYFKYS